MVDIGTLNGEHVFYVHVYEAEMQEIAFTVKKPESDFEAEIMEIEFNARHRD